MWLVFVGMSLSLLLFIYVTKQHLPSYSLVAGGLVTLIALVSFGSNAFDYLSLKSNDLSLREPMNDFETLLAGLVGYFFFPSERKPAFLVVFILGIFIMYYGTHCRKLRGFQKKGLSFFLLSILFEAFLPSIYKVTLTHIDPTYIAFFRTVSVLVLTSIFFPLGKTLKGISSKKIIYGLTSGVIYALGTVTSLYAIHVLGVVQTMLILLLGPALRYLAAFFILKEKVRTGEMVSSLLLAGVALVAVFA
jgi:uncharacterized membrane protein